VGDRIRTGDVQLGNAAVAGSIPLSHNTYGAPAGSLAPQLAPVVETRPSDPDLARVLEAWPTLPAHIKAAVLALIGSAR
jgi:hypothetical protein